MIDDNKKRKGTQYESHSLEHGMPSNRSMPESVIIPELAYPDVREAADWLCEAYGFEKRLLIGDHRTQLTYSKGDLIVTQKRGDKSEKEAVPSVNSHQEQVLHSVMVRVENVDLHYKRAVKNGARIVNPPTDYPYGERQYTAEDPGGHLWTFSQTIADIDPTSWGGEIVNREGDQE
jgi:uncharacterized glyoxalase superfamily protein PhnB